MRSLYALHPDTVLQLHERGAILYGQPLALSMDETEERLSQEPYPRIVVDPVLCRTPDAQRALRRISAQYPETEIAWVRPSLSLRGVPMETLVQELRGEQPSSEPRCAVVVAPADARAGAFCALAAAVQLAKRKDTLLLETDTVDPVYARALRVRPALSEFLVSVQEHGEHPAGWPATLQLVAAPARPELLVQHGMEPLAQRIHERTGRSHVIVRASANLGDRGLIAALSLATDVLICGEEARDGEYLRWMSQLAPRARTRSVAGRRAPLRLAKAASYGAAIWNEGGAANEE